MSLADGPGRRPALSNQSPFELEVFLLLPSRGIAPLGSCLPGTVVETPPEADFRPMATTLAAGQEEGWQDLESLRHAQRNLALDTTLSLVFWTQSRAVPDLRGCFLARLRDPLLTPAPDLRLRRGETWLVLPIWPFADLRGFENTGRGNGHQQRGVFRAIPASLGSHEKCSSFGAVPSFHSSAHP